MSAAAVGHRHLVALTLMAAAVLASGGCGSSRVGQATPPSAPTSPSSTPVSPSAGSCPAQTPRRARVTSLDHRGATQWVADFPSSTGTFSSPVRPALGGGRAFFADQGFVRALDLGGGHQVWQYRAGTAVYGVWWWQGVVAVLSDQVSPSARFTGLDAATGAVRWSVAIPGRGVMGTPVLTGNGGLAWVRADGTVEVRDLATGRPRWSVPEAATAWIVATRGRLVVDYNGVATAYDDRTGARLWSTAGLPPAPFMTVAAGIPLVASGLMGGDQPTAVTALDPDTGRILWRFDAGSAPTIVDFAGAGIAVAVYVPDRKLYLLDPVSGRARWTAGTFVEPESPGVAVPGGYVLTEGGPSGSPDVHLVFREGGTGTVRWQVPLNAQPIVPPVVAGGATVVVALPFSSAPGSGRVVGFRLGDGSTEWSVPVSVPPMEVVVSGDGILVQSFDPVRSCVT